MPLVPLAALTLACGGLSLWLERRIPGDTAFMDPWSLITAPIALLYGPAAIAPVSVAVAAGHVLGCAGPRHRRLLSGSVNTITAVGAAALVSLLQVDLTSTLQVAAAAAAYVALADGASLVGVGLLARTEGAMFGVRRHVPAVARSMLTAALLAPAAVLIGRTELAAAVMALTLALLFVQQSGAAEMARQAAHRAEEAKARQQQQLLELILLEGDRQRRGLLEQIHDGPLQMISAARSLTQMGIEEVQASGDVTDLHEVARALDSAVEELRAQLRSDQTPFRGELYLSTALEHLADVPPVSTSQVRYVADVDAHADGSDAAHAILFMIVREAVTNAVKHSRGTAVRVDVVREGGALVATVSDDGSGIDMEQAQRARAHGHVGMSLMDSRVRAAGGSMTIRSSDAGAQLEFRVPCDLQEDAAVDTAPV